MQEAEQKNKSTEPELSAEELREAGIADSVEAESLVLPSKVQRKHRSVSRRSTPLFYSSDHDAQGIRHCAYNGDYCYMSGQS